MRLVLLTMVMCLLPPPLAAQQLSILWDVSSSTLTHIASKNAEGGDTRQQQMQRSFGAAASEHGHLFVRVLGWGTAEVFDRTTTIDLTDQTVTC